jgi:mannose-6-phosphate isomerase class I
MTAASHSPCADDAVAAFLDAPHGALISPGVQHYGWGNPDFIPARFGMANPEGRPFAEVWMGAHPALPAAVALSAGQLSLAELIARAPARLLGPACADRFGALPFLFKVLSAQQPLSIQVHPNLQQAAAGFARETAAGIPIDARHRNYVDDNHKCELSVALTAVDLLAGFRPPAEIGTNLAVFAAAPRWPAALEATPRDTTEVRTLFAALMALPQPTVNAVIAHAIETLRPDADAFSRSDWQYWVLRADALYARDNGQTRDRGVFAVPMLALLRLSPLEGVYLEPGILHAYLEGNLVEIMANSDNVLRSGLTPKHVDAEELLKVVDFGLGAPAPVQAQPSGRGWIYPSPAAEFELRRRILTPDVAVRENAVAGPALLLVLAETADARVRIDFGTHAERCSGSTVVFLPWHSGCSVQVDGPATLFRAGIGSSIGTEAPAAPTFRQQQPVQLRFGTSGLRGPVSDITDLEAYINTRGFLRYLRGLGGASAGSCICLAGDLRPSTERILGAVSLAVADAGMQPRHCGYIPTPALTAFALQQDCASIMVTGSHIPFDRNGIKFIKAGGEVLKQDEAGILAAVAAVRRQVYGRPAAESPFADDGSLSSPPALPPVDPAAATHYRQRYLDFLPAAALAGLRVVFYQHSAVGRDLIVDLLRELGAEVVVAGRSDAFVAIDTEDIAAARLAELQALADAAGPVDAVLSTDGDSDRPLLAACRSPDAAAHTHRLTVRHRRHGDCGRGQGGRLGGEWRISYRQHGRPPRTRAAGAADARCGVAAVGDAAQRARARRWRRRSAVSAAAAFC